MGHEDNKNKWLLDVNYRRHCSEPFMYVISWASQLSEIDTILFSFTDENLERFGNLFMVTQLLSSQAKI